MPSKTKTKTTERRKPGPKPKEPVLPKEEPKPVGRPRLAISADTVEKLASIGLSAKEIGYALGASERSIYRNFGAYLDKGNSQFVASIKRSQYEVGVLKQNPRMLIHLGVNYAGQKTRLNADDGGQRYAPDNIDQNILGFIEEIESVEQGKMLMDAPSDREKFDDLTGDMLHDRVIPNHSVPIRADFTVE
jgi:hypothetical protein